MKIRFKKPAVFRGYFFTGKPEDKANLVSRLPYHNGYTLLLLPTAYGQLKPKSGEEWRVTVAEIDADPATLIARAICTPIEKVGDAGQVVSIRRGSSFKNVRSASASSPATAAVRSLISSKPAKRTEHGNAHRESLRQARLNAQPKKGPHSEIIPEGTSRDAIRRKRRRARHKLAS